MKFIFALLIIFVLGITLSSSINPKHEFSMEYYYSLRIGEKQDVNVLLDTSQADSVLFKNNDRPYFSFINSTKDEQPHTIEINGLLLRDFKFEIENDKTGLNNKECQGILGLGIEDDGENDLMDDLKEKGVINKRVLYFTTYPVPKIQFLDDMKKGLIEDFTKCPLSDKSDLDDDDYDDFEEGWLCALTHIYPQNATNLNTSIEIKGRAMFDAKSYYMTVPMEYFDLFMDYYSPEDLEDIENVCGSFELNGDKYLSCNFTSEYFNELNNISFVLGGYAYNIKSQKLFNSMGENKYHSLIRFRNIKKNLWVFGFPFFSSYVLEFDYDNESVGFLGESPVNVSSEWAIWVQENMPEKKNIIDTILANKTIMIIGIVSLSIIVLIVISFLIYHCVSKKNKDGMMPLREEVKEKV